jgi:hypothetical protein
LSFQQPSAKLQCSIIVISHLPSWVTCLTVS